jgi:DnaJ-class molecular chaperone
MAAGEEGPSFEQLRKKYQRADAARATNEPPKHKAAATSKLDQLTICKTCNGVGTVEQRYEFLVNTVECAACCGEGVCKN